VDGATPGVNGERTSETLHGSVDAGQVIRRVSVGPGTRIRHYELIRELGRGGMGVVFAARDTKLARRVAIKVLFETTREEAEKFLVEARATARCSGEHIVIIHEVDEHRGAPYMVLELLDGQSLRDAMGGFNTGHRFAASRVVEIALPIARALVSAHAVGIVHRDLKPENVFLTNAGQIKVLDFGIAKAVVQPDARPSLLGRTITSLHSSRDTMDGELVGTIPYMSPEQLGTDAVDARSDLWALGIILFEMLVGRHPVQPYARTAFIASAVDDAEHPRVNDIVPDVPAGVAELVALLLRKRKTQRLASAIDAVRALEALAPSRHRGAIAEGQSPYPGLAAFQEEDAGRFFGRTADIGRIVARLREQPLVGIVGPSGAGKSSFVRAGVVPALKASGTPWTALVVRPGRHPLRALAALAGDDTFDEGRLYAEPGRLGAVLRARARASGHRILVFVDQLEELYTLSADPRARIAFTAALRGIADDVDAPLRVVVSMRSDFLDRLVEDPHFVDELSRGLVFMAAPGRAELREALVQPLEMVGHRFENEAMVENMVAALAGAPSALPLLQFAAAMLWESRDRGGRVITEASYRAIGGIDGALATHADAVIAAMTPAAQRIARELLQRLVTPDRTRAIVDVSEVDAIARDRAGLAAVVDQLVAARLLVAQARDDSAGRTIELVHESLIERWPTLRRWLDDDHDDAVYVATVSAAAKQWDTRGRPAGLLWRGETMQEARRWLAAKPRDLVPRDRAFLDAVFAIARRGRRLRRGLLVATFVLLAAIAAGASIALVWIRGAEQEASDAAARATDEAATAKRALAERRAAETARTAAERERADAERATQRVRSDLDRASTEVADSREQLADKNRKLEAALVEAGAARQRAEAASKKAQDASVELQRAKARVEQALAAETARADRLEQEVKRARLTTHLKD
jgi:tRNA A-37 threonylcarbamoyl transferase component Bud32